MALMMVRRIGVFALTALVASVVVFGLLSVLPGDAARAQLGTNASEADVAALRAELGLDRPAVVRYLDWLNGMFRGDLGTSYSTRTAVGPAIFDALQVSLILVTAGIVVAVVVALPLGTLAAMRQGRFDGVILGAVSQIGVAVPGFLAGLLLITVFAVLLGWLPSGEWVAPIDGVVPFLRHLVLPAVALGIVRGAILARYTRAAVLEVWREDFMRTARAKGLTSGAAMVRHGLRNALVPVLTVTGVEFSALVVGAVVIEKVFVLPGMGSLLLRSVTNRDLVQVQGIVMVMVLLVLVVNLLVDLLHTVIDPRAEEGRMTALLPSTAPVEPQPGAGRRLNASLVVGATLVALAVLTALASFLWPPASLLAPDAVNRLAPPSAEHWLGTDGLGRDVTAQLVAGARVPLLVGAGAVLISLVLGVPFGIWAAITARGAGVWLMRWNDIVQAFPPLLLAIILAAVFGTGTSTAIVALGVGASPGVARVVRAGTLQVLSREYALAARAAGRGTLWLAARHVLPNITSILIVQASVGVALAVLAEAALSFLGLGTPAPTPSWGRALQEAQAVLYVQPLLVLWPGLAIALTVLGFNLLGDGLRDRFDPRMEVSR